MSMRYGIAFGLLGAASLVHAADKSQFDAAVAFGARTSAFSLSISPDGKRISYITPIQGQGTALMTAELVEGTQATPALASKGDPEHMTWCHWIADDRLMCQLNGVTTAGSIALRTTPGLVAVDMDGRNLQSLNITSQNSLYAHFDVGINRLGAGIVDWLPDQGGSLLMSHGYLADDHIGSHFGSTARGLGLDRLDTRTLEVTHQEPPDPVASSYLTDGHGNVRIKGTFVATNNIGTDSGLRHYFYRTANSRVWKPLSDYNGLTGEGFLPLAVDRDQDVVYGVKRKDGRKAIYSLSLDENPHEQLVYARQDVDVSQLLQIGRAQRVVGAWYATDSGHAEYFVDDVKQMMQALSRALPGMQLSITDSTPDGSKMILFASSDTNPGVYYLFDRSTHKLRPFLMAHDQLKGVTLAHQAPMSYPAKDGVKIPGYLTLPPGHQDLKGLPAIVLPHGGPSSRDVWGFDWLPQFFANRGFAVLQPEYRGSSGFGDDWFERNGFQSWRTAIDDVLDAGHWLVSQGVDPGKLAVVGWSYGGYAALQSAVVDSGTFRAVIAIAPVTDLADFKSERTSQISVAADSILPDGPYLQEGSPDEHANAIKVPVLLFHGTFDLNVDVSQSRRMADKLKLAKAHYELVTFEGLDHQLDDSAARTQMLRKSDAFLRSALGLPAQ